MADMHVVTGGPSGWHWSVILHIAVPDADNNVGVNHRTALVNSGLGGATALTEGTEAGQITTAEKTLIEAGEVYEHRADFLLESGGAGAAQQAALRAFYTRTKAEVIVSLQQQLRYFGHTESEA